MEEKNLTPKIRLFADRLLVKVLAVVEEKTTHGIIIPIAGQDAEKVCKRGTVVGMSKKIKEHLDEVDDLALGEVVMFSQYAGSDITYGTEEYKILRATDLFGVDEN